MTERRLIARCVVAILLPAVVLTGCGPSGKPSANTSPSQNAQDQGVKYTQCLRAHGLNVDDNGSLGGDALNGDRAKVDAALKACQSLSPKRGIDPNDPAQHDRVLKIAQCMRKHGVNVADPQPGQGLNFDGTGKDDAIVQDAYRTCHGEVGR
jgi:hypothetical protein